MEKKCDKCKSTIRGEVGNIRCEGVCGKYYHLTRRCSGLDQCSIDKLQECEMLRFMCADCVHYVNNVDDILKDMQMVVKQNGQQLQEYRSEFDNALRKNEQEIKHLLQAVETAFSERIRAMQKAQESCEKSVKEVNKIREIAEGFKASSEQVCVELKTNKDDNKKMIEAISNENKKMCNELKENVNNVEAKISYANITKMKPSKKQDAEMTKNDLNSKVDPKELQITNIVTTQSGVVIVESKNDQERDKIKNAIETNLGNAYEVKIPKKVKPTVVVSGINFKYDNDELAQRIKRQNACLTETDIKIIKQYEKKKGSNVYYNAVLEVDVEAFTNILAGERINVGWERCRVYDAVQVLCCFKCKGFHHKASGCQEREVCTKCLGEHKHTQCDKEPIKKCINCIRANKELNLGLNDNHDTMDRACPVYQQKLSARKKKIVY
ncbi:uncharacterized protein LOC118749421 [Rhagoletis pomonella]|uniref:uncharacterized protein LOC118749421 n=1 Tax=Rhagoletis pomonella TaxID=28610 RepID=UPI001786A867|nr:uncharacterized protein LOC118749421 [Rhagoletis pomonella]